MHIQHTGVVRVSLAIQASTGTPVKPELSLNVAPIPYLGDSTITFGSPVSFVKKKMDIRQSVKTKLKVLLIELRI